VKWGWWLVPLGAVLAAYLPDLGRGFIKDDFAWILGSRTSGPLGFIELFGRDNGFYRPLVSLTFALDERLFGLEPYGYGLTNLALVLGCMFGLYALGRSLGMPGGTALLAASIWALNPHGVGGAILWISGRTALLLTLFSLLAAASLLKGWYWAASAFCLAALLSKEEAVLLPAILTVWAGAAWTAGGVRWDWRKAYVPATILAIPLVVYMALRMRTAAYLPHSAPHFYKPTLMPATLVQNVLEYSDRSGTLAAVVVLVVMIALRRRPRLDDRERQWLRLGLVWLVGGYALTVFLPVRSSLYACFPLVGSALAAAAMVNALWRNASEAQRRRLLGAGIVAAAVLVPLHRSRNVRMVKTAELSTRVLADVAGASGDIAAGKMLVIHDAVGARYNVEKTFGTLIQEAVRLRTGPPAARVWVDPPLGEWEGAGLQPPTGQPAVHYWLREGRLVGADGSPP
jgi:hypothetical protein